MSTQVPIVQHPTREWDYPNTKTGLTPADIREEHLWGVNLNSPITGEPFPDRKIWHQIREAEDTAEKSLSIRFRPTRIVCEPSPETPHDTYDEIEKAYDYDPTNFDTYRWGRVKLRKAPVTSISEFAFGFPNRATGLFTVPQTWVRVHDLSGVVKLLPDGQGVAVGSFYAWLLAIMSGGRGIPHGIYVSYAVGNTPEWWSSNHHDLIQAVADLAASQVLELLATAKTAKSGGSISVSVDGMSQSRSSPGAELLKAANERHKAAEETLAKWGQRAKGPLLEWL